MKKLPPTIRVILFLVVLGLIAGATAFTREKAGPKLEFQLVATWPTLPAGPSIAMTR